MNNKITEALKLSLEALEEAKHALENGCKWIEPKWDDEWRVGRGAWMVADKALAAIREALAEPVKQEPVAWVNAERNTITWEKIYPNMEPLYAAPVDAKAIRAEALEEAAKVCDDYYMDHIVGQQLAAAIRRLE
jgi:hypothetical protein